MDGIVENGDPREAIRARGWTLLRLADVRDPQAAEREALRRFTRFARPLVQYADGTLVHHVEDRGRDAHPRTYYSHGTGGGDLHTDGTYMHLLPPDLIALCCIRPAHDGGDTLLVDGHAIIEALAPPARAALSRLHHFDTDGQVPGTATLRRPIVGGDRATRRLHYLRRYIESGHAAARAPLDAASVAAMDQLDALAARPEWRTRLRLRGGDLLLVDNHRMLHGRTAFTDAPGAPGRLLLRLWGRACS